MGVKNRNSKDQAGFERRAKQLVEKYKGNMAALEKETKDFGHTVARLNGCYVFSDKEFDDVSVAADAQTGGEPFNVDLSLFKPVTGDMVPERAISRVMSHRIAKEFMTLVAGGGGVGKSTYMITAALDIAQGGGKGLGEPIHCTANLDGYKVLYVNLEDGQIMVDRMVRASMDEHGHSRTDNLVAMGRDTFRQALGGRDLNILTQDSGTRIVAVNPHAEQALKNIITGLGIEVLILDPMKNLYHGVPMTNEATNVLYDMFARICVDCFIAVVCGVHTRKPSGSNRGDQDQHDIKHGTEIVDTARCAISMNKISRTKLQEWGVDPHRNIVKAATTKSNIGPSNVTHYEITLREVLCADGNTEIVGTAKEYKPPQTAGVADIIWEDVRHRLITEWVADYSGSKKPTLKSIVEDALKKHGMPVGGANKISNQMKGEGWITTVNEKRPNSENRTRIKRSIVGPNDPHEDDEE